MIVSLFLLTVIVFSFEKFYVDKELYFITYLIVVGQGLFPVWYFQGLERMKYITSINILSRIVFTVAIFIFIHDEGDYILLPVLNSLGVVSGSVYSLYIIKKVFNQKFVFQDFITIYKYFKDSTDFFFSRVSVSIYTSANAIVLGLFTNNTMVAYYSIAEKLYQAIQGFYGPINQALYPYVAKEKNIKLFKKIFYSVIILNIMGVIFLFYFGESIFTLLFTQEIGDESIEVFHIFLLANLVTVPSVLIGYPLLGALGYTQYANSSVIFGSFIHFLGLSVLVFFGNVNIYSVVLMVVLTELFVFTYRMFWVINKKLYNEVIK